MELNRKLEIEKEGRKRLDLWMQQVSFNEMTVHGSLIRFDMALGLLGGYPFIKEDWMNESEFNGFVSDAEFDDLDYDDIILKLFKSKQPSRLQT
mgnify:CR=1 FL=1